MSLDRDQGRGARQVQKPYERLDNSAEGKTLATISDAKTGEQLHFKTPCSTCKTLGLPCAIEGNSVSLRTRRGQTLALTQESGDTAFVVRAGLLILHVTFPGSSQQIAGIYFPGDLLHIRYAPPLAQAAIVAASMGEIWRIRAAVLEALATTEPAVRRYLDEAVASRIARQAISVAMLGQFDGEQRVATLLIELAVRIGTNSPGGRVAFEMPFSRKDVADYLGLNPDTVSRIMSRFRASGLIAYSDRSRMIIPDLAALAARSPAARSLGEISSRRRDVALSAAV
jgi:CRP/FNR family transcriptional regulator